MIDVYIMRPPSYFSDFFLVIQTMYKKCLIKLPEMTAADQI